MLEPRKDTRQEDQAHRICRKLEDLTIDLCGWQFTEEQWQTIRLAWVHFAEVFAPTREPNVGSKGEILESKDDSYKRAMELLK